VLQSADHEASTPTSTVLESYCEPGLYQGIPTRWESPSRGEEARSGRPTIRQVQIGRMRLAEAKRWLGLGLFAFAGPVRLSRARLGVAAGGPLSAYSEG
jgi:hypothetical protein